MHTSPVYGEVNGPTLIFPKTWPQPRAPKRRTIVKYLTTITLIGLIAFACFVPTHLYSADWARDARMGSFLKFIYGYVKVEYSYEFPNVTSNHSAVIYNDSGGVHPDWPQDIRVKYYADATSKLEPVKGKFNQPFEPEKGAHAEGWVDAADSWSWIVPPSLEFDLIDQPWGEYKITTDTLLTVKADLDFDGTLETVEKWHALISEEKFPHRREPLGVE